MGSFERDQLTKGGRIVIDHRREASRPRTPTDSQLEDLLRRAEEARLIDGWCCAGNGYEVTVLAGSFHLEPNAARAFVSKLFEVTDDRPAFR